MPDGRIKKIVAFGAGIVPILAFIGTLSLWVDTRYMHKELSDTRFIEIQMALVKRDLKDYERSIDFGHIVTEEEKRIYELQKKQLENLTTERNKVLGLGE